MFSLQVASQIFTLSRARSTTNSMQHYDWASGAKRIQNKVLHVSFSRCANTTHSCLVKLTAQVPFPDAITSLWSFNSSLKKQTTFSIPTVDCRIDWQFCVLALLGTVPVRYVPFSPKKVEILFVMAGNWTHLNITCSLEYPRNGINLAGNSICQSDMRFAPAIWQYTRAPLMVQADHRDWRP
jgi:hypothetical protein